MRTKLTKLLFALFAVMVGTSVNATIYNGNCGTDGHETGVTWSFDTTTGTLTISGTGAIKDYSSTGGPTAYPWSDATAVANFNPMGGEYDMYWTGITSLVIGEGITDIPDWAFAMQMNIASVSLPSTLKTIGNSALEECAFTTIDLPEGLTTISDYAFQIGALTTVTIPSTVTFIGEVAFQANDNLTSVTFLNTDPTTITFGENVFQSCDNLTAINVPAAAVDAYKTALPAYASLIVAGGAPAPATSGSCGTNATWSYSNGIMTIGGSGAMTDYSSSMTDIPWIAYQESITKVVIGDEITHVGDWAFQGCTALNSITIGENVTSIGNGSFDNCTNAGFTVLTIPNSVQTIGIDAFSNNHLKYVCFGSGLTSIGMEAFMVCQDLEAIGVYASTPPTLGMDAFMACSNLATIYVPSAKIGDYQAANGWSDYAAMIKSPGGECGTNATWTFDMATRTLTIEGTGAIADFSGWDSTQDNDSRAFNPLNTAWYPCGIKNVVIGEGIIEIPGSAFYMEVGITEVTLPSTLTAIGMDAFSECDNIETITCNATNPPTLADNGNESYVFYSNDFTDPNNPVIIPIATITAINVPAASVDAYKAAAGWSVYADKIVAQGGGAPATTTTFTYTATEQVTKFDTYANFTGATGVASHTFDNGAGTVVYEGTVTSLGLRALNSTKLTSITIPESVTAIGERAFADCATLATITFEGTPAITTIGDYAFAGCDALTSFTVPEGVTAIGTGGFQSCDELAAVTIPESVANMGDYVFNNCKKLATVTFTGTPTLAAISSRAFYNCEALTAIAIPAKVAIINSDAFEGCKLLASVTFPASSVLTTIGTAAFQDCKALTTIALPESVTTLGEIQVVGEKTYYNNSIFWGSGLTTFVLPKNVTNIYGGGMFANCPMTSLTVDAANTKYDSRDGANAIFETATDKLVVGCIVSTVPDGTKAIGREAFFAEQQTFSLTLPESVTSIEERAFHYATGLTAINIPSGVTEIGDETFPQCNITELVIPDGVTSIGKMAFMMCEKLEKVTFGTGLTTIDEYAFDMCSNVTDVYCYAAPFTTWNGSGFADSKATQFHVSDADAWSTAFPAAKVTFVGDLVASRPETHDVEKGGVTANWSTYYNSTQNVVADANTEVYQVSLTGTALTLTKVDDRIINAGQGVVLKSTDANVVLLTSDTQSATSYANNSLKGTDTQITNPGNAYVLANGNSVLGFHKLSAGGTIKAHKAYLTYSGSGAPEFFALEGNVTGIKAIDNGQWTIDNVVYDLQGRRVSKPTKGLYIVNGKKVIIK